MRERKSRLDGAVVAAPRSLAPHNDREPPYGLVVWRAFTRTAADYLYRTSMANLSLWVEIVGLQIRAQTWFSARTQVMALTGLGPDDVRVEMVNP